MNKTGHTVRRMKAATVSIVDDNDGLRASLEEMLNGTREFRCIAAYPDGETALKHIPAHKPDVVLMDINMPGLSGIECVRRLKKTLPDLRIVMLTVFNDDEHLFESLKAGADGYLLKHTPGEALLGSLSEILGGGAPVSPQIARSLIEYFHELKATAPAPGSKAASADELTGRELQILDKLTEGWSYKEIAAEFSISIHTVGNHLRHIYEKLHVHSRAQAVRKHLARAR
jgi:DNA-binding NarL/FixJ family response regulator